MLFKMRPFQIYGKLSAPKLNHLFKVGTYNCVRNLVNVIQDEKNGTARVMLQKPPVNSLSLEMLNELTSTIKDLEEKKLRGIIISSDSSRVFCAGLDITELYKPSEERLRIFWKAFQTFWKTLYSTPLVTVAAVNGHAPAGGCVMVLSCDHSIMVNSDVRIGLNESLLGFAAPKWVRLLLVNACKNRAAEHALKISKLFTPKEALDFGIVDELVDSSSDLLPKAEEALNQLLKVPALAFQKEKLSFRKPFVDDLISYEDQDTDDVVKVFLQDETQNIIGKYLENLKTKKK
ncbi:enoyl-CoA delta isomerase 1, mitochondrial-like isoform X1 [Argiope bruennichi]|uniref:enoyl-CoA delta isomerase 1, mitochondrial-like isoform X1 n=1 Tax=Argiope bruennichi TaxID=94029 RepID=UPI002495666C|nr:enoyl-CoA delta isomerase 1, mitochondrial-like isoform X1 [Argiope bruennichi]